MKKIGIIVLFVLLAAGTVCFLPKPAGPKTGGKLTVVTSGYVAYTLTRQLAGEFADIIMLLPPNAEPHSFEPTPGVLVAVRQADLFIYISDAFEPWAKDIAAGAGKNTQVVKAAGAVPASADPHVWMDFDNVRLMAKTVEEALVVQLPEQAQTLAQNLAKFNGQLTALDDSYKKGLSSCQGREVVHIGHLAFGRLAQKYGFTLTALAGTSHDGEHSVRRLAGVVDLIKHHHIQTIFTEETLSPRLAQTVAAETGAQILPLYTVESISKQDFDNHITYIDLMKRNLDNLQRGLKCQA